MKQHLQGNATVLPSRFAVIFDMDGVLVDSEPLNIRAYVQAWSEFGVRLSPEEYVDHFTNRGTLIQTLFVSRGGRPTDWDALFVRKTEIYRELAKTDLKPMPGAMNLLADLETNGIPRALATSASRVTMEVVLCTLDLARHFVAIVALEDVAKQKPDPEAFLRAAALLQTPPDRCIVLEDAPKGLVAAKAAGMRCVIVPTELSRSEDFSAADLVVGSLEGLTAGRLWELIKGNKA